MNPLTGGSPPITQLDQGFPLQRPVFIGSTPPPFSSPPTRSLFPKNLTWLPWGRGSACAGAEPCPRRRSATRRPGRLRVRKRNGGLLVFPCSRGFCPVFSCVFQVSQGVSAAFFGVFSGSELKRTPPGLWSVNLGLDFSHNSRNRTRA